MDYNITGTIMPFKCSVPGCRSNYEPPYVTCFRFPKHEERRKLWISRIRRQIFKYTENARVCIKHFPEDMIIREDKWQDKDGRIHTFPRANSCLSSDAFPTVVTESTPHLNFPVPKKRRTREEKEEEAVQEALHQSIASYEEELESNRLPTYEDVNVYIQKCVKEMKDWAVAINDTGIAVLKVNKMPVPCIVSSFVVSYDRCFKMYVADKEQNPATWNIEFNVITEKSHVDALLKLCDVPVLNLNENKLAAAVKLLKEHEVLDSTEKVRLSVLIEQIELLSVKKERYRFSSDLIRLALKMFLISPACYRAIRQSQILTLPHPGNLRKLAANLNVSDNNFNISNSYIVSRISSLKPEERIVNLLMDEIYISPELTFKGGQLVGTSSTDTQQLAKTAQVFSVNAAFGSYADVVAILPVSVNSGDLLHVTVNNILHELSKLSVTVISIIADNNQINKSLFHKLTPHSFGYYSVVNPFCPSQPLFLLYDTVHIFKNIRNNWINQKDLIFHFPDFVNPDIIKTANFGHLRSLYHKEKNKLLKFAHQLNSKAVYPSNIERQKVNLVCKMFNYENINALIECDENYKETAEFLTIILKWWNIVNVKFLNQNVRYQNDDYKAIFTIEQEQLTFLSKFSACLCRGNAYQGLTRRTFDAIMQTCSALFGLVKYALTELKVSYVLLGKFQTDPLEERFSLYRQLSGSNYFISLQQLYESEKKIRIKNMLSFSSKIGNISVKSLNTNSESANKNVPSLLPFCDLEIEISKPVDKDILPIVYYIAGYAAFKVANGITCPKCIELLLLSDTLEYEFEGAAKLIDSLSRGSLKKPTVYCVKVTWLCIQLFQSLVNEFYDDFIKSNNQLALLKNLCSPYVINIVDDARKL